MDTTNWEARFSEEIQKAEQARVQGNEGMARVCARRAAGIAIAAWYERQGAAVPGPSAYDCLQALAHEPGAAPSIHAAVSQLLLRVDANHRLPSQADLIAETRNLAKLLFSPRHESSTGINHAIPE